MADGLRRAIAITLVVAGIGACGGGGGGSTQGPTAGTSQWSIPSSSVVDGGPGKDGIPSVDSPVFERADNNLEIADDTLVVGVRFDGETKAYPHDILTWHEIVNDGDAADPFVVSFCPLTGSAVAWETNPASSDPTFGVSGLLYESNLILYDRATDSHWSQMLEESVEGLRRGDRPKGIQVIETTMATWREMYPDSKVMTRSTGYTRDYDATPYPGYTTNSDLLFSVSSLDSRLHPKERVIGITTNTENKAYQVAQFGPAMQAINDHVGGESVVVVGSSAANIAAIYSRELDDGTILDFSPLDGQLPVVMRDSEGNVWDIFGQALSGPRVGTVLAKTRSYTAMWFAWAVFHDDTILHFN
jgi:hypothetical protein